MRRKNLITIIATFLIVIGLITSSFLTDYASLIASLTTSITAIVGAIALYLQFKRDKDINQQSFILEFSKQFYETYNCEHIYKLLDQETRGKSFEYNDEVMFEALKALEWCESLAGLIKDEVITIDSIEKLCSYRFFVITNNKKIQDNEILPYRDFYQGVIWLHKEFTNFERKHGNKIIKDENNLSDRLAKENI